MTDAVRDAAFDAWLTSSYEALVESTLKELDVEAMLVEVKRHQVAHLPTAHRVPRDAAGLLVRTAGAVAGRVSGALVLASGPTTSAIRDPKVLPFPGGASSDEAVRHGQSTGDSASDMRRLVNDAVSGDRRATERLLARVRPLIVRYCRARVGRQERSFASADDVAQEVCLAVLTTLSGYQDQGRPFLAFVYGIAAHKVADAHRAAARNRTEPVAQVPDEAESQAGPEQVAMQAELSEQMTALLRVLPAKQQEILVLRVVVGLSAEETAEVVGSTPGAVRVAQHRALARLRAALPGWYVD